MRSEEFLEAARSIAPWIVEVRRHIHRNPELGRAEFETADYIEGKLEELGIEHRRLGTAVLGLIRGALPGGVVALRADIDALPVEEETPVEYRSRKPGIMHACGHDAHTAILLGAARLLAEGRAALPGGVKLFFQPDEEGDGGAEAMIAAGVLEDPRVDRVFGLHVMPYLEVGEIETKKGALNGSSSTLYITVRGKGSHGAYPEQGIDAVLIASAIVVSLNTLVARFVSPLDQAVLTVGSIHGGTRSNIVADEVRMEATLRTTDDGIRDLLEARVRSVVEGVAASFGGSGSVDIQHGYRALVNHDAEVELVARTAEELLGPGALRWKEKPSMGVEDFSFFLKERPGAFYHLGCGKGPAESRAPLHSSRFELNEDCLPLGAALQAALVFRSLEG